MGCTAVDRFQSTLPVGGATRADNIPARPEIISIHAPRGGSDAMVSLDILTLKDFNPRSPWGERRSNNRHGTSHQIFQSTLPVGGATKGASLQNKAAKISIHAPRGGSDSNPASKRRKLAISIHAPRGGSDDQWHNSQESAQLFQSTLPVGGATCDPAYSWER